MSDHRTRFDEITSEHLDPLQVELRALREDLAAYRWAIEQILRRRLYALVGTILVVVVAMVVIGIGAVSILNLEEARAERTLEISRLESCSAARDVQATLLEILRGLEDVVRPESRVWLEEALQSASGDPCDAVASAAG